MGGQEHLTLNLPDKRSTYGLVCLLVTWGCISGLFLLNGSSCFAVSGADKLQSSPWRASSSVAWDKCGENLECGRIRWALQPEKHFHYLTEYTQLSVPKDYFDADSGTASIAMVKFKAKNPKKGTVFFNPGVQIASAVFTTSFLFYFFPAGGPGGSGTLYMLTAGESIAVYVGDDYDVVGFDPRGIGQTT